MPADMNLRTFPWPALFAVVLGSVLLPVAAPAAPENAPGAKPAAAPAAPDAGLKQGAPAAEVRKLLGEPAEIRAMKAPNGKAEVRQIFKVKGVAVAGCYVTEGKIVRSAKMRLLRDGAVVWEGKVASLKRFKDDVRDVAEGFECGISLDGYNDLKEKDILDSYDVDEIKQRL